MAVKKRSGHVQERETYIFHLYVTGASPNSMRAIENTKKMLQEYFKEFELEIIDVYQQPQIAQRENIIALPLLIKKKPLPEKRFIGAIAEMDKILYAMGITNRVEQL